MSTTATPSVRQPLAPFRQPNQTPILPAIVIRVPSCPSWIKKLVARITFHVSRFYGIMGTKPTRLSNNRQDGSMAIIKSALDTMGADFQTRVGP